MSLFPEFTADHEMPLGGKGDLDHVGGDVQAVEGVDLGGEGDVHGDILPLSAKYFPLFSKYKIILSS